MAVNLGKVILGFVTLLVGIILTPTIESTVRIQLVNLTGASATVADLIPLFWILVIISIAVSLMWQGFKDVSD